jgi:hypothetical protein
VLVSNSKVAIRNGQADDSLSTVTISKATAVVFDLLGSETADMSCSGDRAAVYALANSGL